MYTVDDRDLVVEISSLPQSDVGAPLPGIIATEHETYLIYYLSDPPNDWDGTSVRVVSHSSKDLKNAVVSFERCYAHLFGPPNDEAFEGHPLSGCGLHSYGIFEVRSSSWLRSLEQMNSVHPYHDADRFLEFKHYVFAFHDSTFECITASFTCNVQRGSTTGVLKTLAERIE